MFIEEQKTNKVVDYYDRKEVSNSDLGLFEVSPSLYYNKVILGNNDEERKESKAMENGKLIHSFIEKPNEFITADVDKIEGLMGIFIEAKAEGLEDDEALKKSGFKESYYSSALRNFHDEKNKAYYNYLKTTKSSDYIISSATKKILNSCIYSIQNNKTISDLLFTKELFWDVFNEEEIYWTYIPFAEDGSALGEIPCRSKLDKIIIDYERKEIIVIDFKTTGNSVHGEFIQINQKNIIDVDFYATGFFKTNFLKYSLYRQAAFYNQAVLEWLVTNPKFIGEDFTGYKFKYYIIPIETKYPFDCCIYHITESILKYGHVKINELMKEYLWCKQTGLWKRRKYYENTIMQVS